MSWIAFAGGDSVGQRGSEDGIVLRDDEHSSGVRITLEQGGHIAPFSITCGIYGWMFHTRFFDSQQKAEVDYTLMKDELANILNLIPLKTDPQADEKMVKASSAISNFVGRYP